MDEYGIFNDIALFRSRNRDDFQFKLGLPLTPNCVQCSVSISESRGFSFQVQLHLAKLSLAVGFDLGIERLLGSSQLHMTPDDDYMITFQSRNREFFSVQVYQRYKMKTRCIVFQSRNRGSFNFKWKSTFLVRW